MRIHTITRTRTQPKAKAELEEQLEELRSRIIYNVLESSSVLHFSTLMKSSVSQN